MKSMKQVSLLIVLAAMVLFTSLDSSAQQIYIYDGNRLVEKMREYEKSHRSDPSTVHMYVGIYMGYVAGVYDATTGVFDPPVDVTIDQVCSIVAKYLNETPEKWNQPANVLVMEALRNAFPKR